MFNFNAVSENVYEESLNDLPHTRSEHTYIDGGYIIRDTNDKILAFEIPTSNTGFEYYVAVDIVTTIH